MLNQKTTCGHSFCAESLADNVGLNPSLQSLAVLWSCTYIDLPPHALGLTLHQEALRQSRSDEDHPLPSASSSLSCSWCAFCLVPNDSCDGTVMLCDHNGPQSGLLFCCCLHSSAHFLSLSSPCTRENSGSTASPPPLLTPDLKWHHISMSFPGFALYCKTHVCLYIYVYRNAATVSIQGGPLAKNIIFPGPEIVWRVHWKLVQLGAFLAVCLNTYPHSETVSSSAY